MIRGLAGLAIAAAAAGALGLGCSKANGGDTPRPPAERPGPKPVENVHHTAQNWSGPALPKAQVILPDAYGGKRAVEVEVAATDPMRERGMMWRTQLAEGKGMLFVFPVEEEHSFWMRNTLVPLDIVFIDSKGTIVGIVENAEPKSLVSRTVGKPSKYVLEVPGGWTGEVGIRAGSRAELHGVDAIPVR